MKSGVAARLLALALLAGCADEPSEPTPNPLPALLGVAPSDLIVGGGPTTVTLTGTGFVSGSRARWNGADRVTRFQNAQALSVDLLVEDLADVGTGEMTVVNGAPGGGTSGVVEVRINYPPPQISGVTPREVPVQPLTDGTVRITIAGTGFAAQPSVRIGSRFIPWISVTPTQIVAEIPAAFLTLPGTFPIVVLNPAPGGGESNAISFDVLYAVPAIILVSPDSALSGAGFVLTVHGSGFGPNSVLRWKGTDLPATVQGRDLLTAAIPANQVQEPGDATVQIFNPAPGGGVSNVVTMRIREQAPIITGVSPGSIIAGSGATTLTVSGSNFRAGATAELDGQARAATLISATSMTVSLLAGDVTAPRVAQLTVTNPGASGVSNAVAVVVTSASPTLAVTRVIALTHNDLAWDAARGVIYASVPSGSLQQPNTVVRINPATGAITGAVAVGSNPGVLAITEDFQYLYVGLIGASRIVRVALATFTPELDINLPEAQFFGARYAEDIVPIPGAPRTIAVSTYHRDISPRNGGTFVFDDASPRPASGPNHTGANRITRGLTAARIYGYNNETTEFGFRSFLVLEDGLHEETVKGSLVMAFGADIEFSGALVYATTGDVIDVGSMLKTGTIPSQGVVRPDAANGRVHFLVPGGGIFTYHYTGFNHIGDYDDPALLVGRTRLIRWGTDGLAAGGGDSIVLLRGGLVAP